MAIFDYKEWRGFTPQKGENGRDENLIYDRELQTLAAPISNNTPGELWGTFHSRNKGKEKDKIMERIFSFLQYIYSVMLHANEPSGDTTVFDQLAASQKYLCVDDDLRRMASTYIGHHAPQNTWVVECSQKRRKDGVGVCVCEIVFRSPTFLHSARRGIGYERCNIEWGLYYESPKVTLYTNDDTETIRGKIRELENNIVSIWSRVVSDIVSCNDRDLFKSPEAWEIWRKGLKQFLVSCQNVYISPKTMWEYLDNRKYLSSYHEEFWSEEGLSFGKKLPSFNERGWEHVRDVLHEYDQFSLLYL